MPKAITLTILSESCAETRGKLHLTSESTVFLKGSGKKRYSCGRCGALLLDGVDRLMMENAAGKCNKCGTYNSLEKPSVYKRAPLTIQDMDKIEEPPKHFRMSGLWESHKLASQFRAISDHLLNAWNSEQGRRPDILYHYTSLDGLNGILENDKLWQTDIAFLNDASEMQLGIDLIEEEFRQQEKTLNDIGAELLRRSSISTSPVDTSMGVYVSCFCRDGDLLSQWRAYGSGGGGYALGFNAKEISRSGQIQVRKVVYKKEKQINFIKSTLDATIKLFTDISKGKTIADLDSDNTLPAFASFLSDHLAEFLCCFKHESFKEEDEWRAITYFNRSKNAKALRFRGNQSFPVPYLESDILDKESKMPGLPLVEIIHGPTLHPQLTKKALNLLLEKHNYEFVEVRGSNAPLRA